MKKIIVTLFAASALFAACNKDYPVPNADGPFISSIEISGRTENAYSFEYDAKGQLTKVLEYSLEDEEKPLEQYYTYEYSKGKIEQKLCSVGGEVKSTLTHTLNSKGYIVKTSDGTKDIEFSYDSEGHLVKSGNTSFTWSGGDIVSNSDGAVYTPSEVMNPGFWPVTEAGTDNWLYLVGRYGKFSKHLPAEINNESAKELVLCEYEMEGGSLVRVEKSVTITAGNTPSITGFNYNIFWMK